MAVQSCGACGGTRCGRAAKSTRRDKSGAECRVRSRVSGYSRSCCSSRCRLRGRSHRGRRTGDVGGVAINDGICRRGDVGRGVKKTHYLQPFSLSALTRIKTRCWKEVTKEPPTLSRA